MNKDSRKQTVIHVPPSPLPLWIPVFHIYQPPQQRAEIIEQIMNESYDPLLTLAKEHPAFRFTLNVNGSLLVQLKQMGYTSWLQTLADLIVRGQIELMGTAAYHPILPLLPEMEIKRQIELNEQLQEKTIPTPFTHQHVSRSFWLPELAYSPRLDPILKSKGYQLLILSNTSRPSDVPDPLPGMQNQEGMTYFFRNDELSNLISFQSLDFPTLLQQINEHPLRLVITAQDGETYGHHRPQLISRLLHPAVEQIQATADKLELNDPSTLRQFIHDSARAQNQNATENTLLSLTLSELEELVFAPRGEKPHEHSLASPLTPLASSWSTSPDDLKKGIPYPLWNHPLNQLHLREWQLLEKARKLVLFAEAKLPSQVGLARQYLDWSMHSCTWWWSSGQPWYSPEMIIRGTSQMVTAAIEAYKQVETHLLRAKQLSFAEEQELKILRHDVLLLYNEILCLI